MRLIDVCPLVDKYTDIDTVHICIEEVLDDLESAPTVDAVPVIRCEECEYWEETSTHGRGRCWEDVPNRRFTNDGEFCNRAERREDHETD